MKAGKVNSYIKTCLTLSISSPRLYLSVVRQIAVVMR